MIYWQLFLSFLQIGMFSFGGGYAALPLIQEQVVTQHEWLSRSEFTDLITISQIAPAWESVSTLALIRAAQNGLGIAILPELLVRDALKSGDLVSLPLPPDILTRSLYLIRHRNKYLSSSAEEFQNLCRMWKF